MSSPILFVDRDGTIITEPADHQVTTSTWLASPSPAAPPDFEPELPEVAHAARVAATAVVPSPASTARRER